jgi:hypothetical protein
MDEQHRSLALAQCVNWAKEQRAFGDKYLHYNREDE